MAESTEQLAMSEGQNGHVLTALNDPQEHINRVEIKFSQLVVFGDEGAGKSALIEAICKVPLPEGRKLTIRTETSEKNRGTGESAISPRPEPSEFYESASVPDDASVITENLMNGTQTHLPGFHDS